MQRHSIFLKGSLCVASGSACPCRGLAIERHSIKAGEADVTTILSLGRRAAGLGGADALAAFMGRTGQLKTVPASWRETFVPPVSERPEA